MDADDLRDIILDQNIAIQFEIDESDSSIEYISQFIPNAETALILLENYRDIILAYNKYPETKDYIKRFLQEIISHKKIEYVLDPNANFGEMLYLTEEVYPNVNKTGYNLEQEIIDFNFIVQADFEQKPGNLYELLEQEKSKYDLIVTGFFELQKIKQGGLSIYKDEENFILKCLSVLSDDGLLISGVIPNIFDKEVLKRFNSKLNDKGFYLKALFATPFYSVFQFPFSRKCYLIVIEKGKGEFTFLAEISLEADEQNRILKNYKNMRNSDNLLEGLLLPIDKIEPLDDVLKRHKINLLLKKTGLPSIPLKQLGKFKNLNEIEKAFLIIPNKTIITSKIKNVTIGYSKENIDEKSNHFFEVNTKVIEPQYLLELLNSNFGKTLLGIIAERDLMFKSIRLKDLEDLSIPVNTMQTQRKIIELSRSINNSKEQLKILESSLWNYPSELSEIEKKTNRILKNPDNIDWIEELPFPLASILWNYYSGSDTRIKVDYLLKLFEGYCEFIVTMILSYLSKDKSFFEKTVKFWLNNVNNPEWYINPTFGNWQYLYKTLTSKIKSKLKTDEGKKLLYDIFLGANGEFIDLITSKEIASTLYEAKERRNDLFHGTIPHEVEFREALSFLEIKLYKIKEILLSGFSNLKLLKPIPKSINWDSESLIFNTTCKLLNGTRPKFKQIEVQTNIPLSSNELYILHENQINPVKLIPTVQLREPPRSSQIGFYFFYGIKEDKVRLVSYHIENESELKENKDNYNNVFKILNPFGKNRSD